MLPQRPAGVYRRIAARHEHHERRLLHAGRFAQVSGKLHTLKGNFDQLHRRVDQRCRFLPAGVHRFHPADELLLVMHEQKHRPVIVQCSAYVLCAGRDAVALRQCLVRHSAIAARFLTPFSAPLIPRSYGFFQSLEIPWRDVLRQHAPGKPVERDFGVSVCH
jgi:hypothetical protein